MKKISILFFLIFFLGKNLLAQNAAPTITNLVASTDLSNNTITLTYDLEDLENDDVEITMILVFQSQLEMVKQSLGLDLIYNLIIK